LGLLISASASTQQQALFMSWFVMLFVLLMSGFMFPIENMPHWAQQLTYLNPMRYLMVVTRELLIKGSGIRELYQQGIALLLLGGFIFTIALLRFQKRSV
jgi:ABC-2 type transport system permease protein